MRVVIWIGVFSVLSVAVVSLTSCSDEREAYTPSELELIGFIASHFETARDHREICDRLVEDFEDRWRKASTDEYIRSIFVVLLLNASGDINMIQHPREELPTPEAKTLRKLDEEFSAYLDLVREATRTLLAAFQEADVSAAMEAADEAGATLALARDAELRLADLIAEVTGGEQQ